MHVVQSIVDVWLVLTWKRPEACVTRSACLPFQPLPQFALSALAPALSAEAAKCAWIARCPGFLTCCRVQISGHIFFFGMSSQIRLACATSSAEGAGASVTLMPLAT